MKIALRLATAAAGLAAGLMLLSPAGRADEPLTDAQKQAVEAQIHSYIMAHPEVIIDALQAYEKQQSEKEAAGQKQAIVDRRDDLLHTAGDPVGGNPQATLTVVEFFDYHCPYCKAVAPDFLNTVQGDGDLRVVFKEFPILGDGSVLAAKAALAADKQGKYLEMHRGLMALKGDLSEEAVFGVAKAQGLDVDKLKADIKAPDIEERLSKTYELARALGINGTPAFIIGDELIPGALPMSDLKAKVDQQRKG